MCILPLEESHLRLFWFTWLYFLYTKIHPLKGFVRLSSDNWYIMNLEPGRCRRTDGKRWRCHKSVVPNEKYCETHMHRGRKRSRKLVETSIRSASLNCYTPNSTNTNKRNNPNNDSKIKNCPILDHKPQFPPNNNPMSSDSSNVQGNNVAKEAPTTVVVRAPNFNTSGRICKDDKKYNASGEFNDNFNKGIVIMNQSSGLDFSPDSVLQGVLRHPSVEKCKFDLNTESERCRRTDGKKWRCSNKVVPHQKYCANHMNRGAKKPVTLMSTTRDAKYAFDSAPSLHSNRSERDQIGFGTEYQPEHPL